jgi:hypothetical protein
MELATVSGVFSSEIENRSERSFETGDSTDLSELRKGVLTQKAPISALPPIETPSQTCLCFTFSENCRFSFSFSDGAKEICEL